MVRLQAVTGGLAETGTLERIQALLRAGTFDVELGKRLLQGGLEIFRQKALLEVRENAGLGDGAWLLPDSLSPPDEFALREALEAVANLQKVIHSSLAEKV
jgi:signal-transduction protein with cAMP-binding, CBS, and nucleotidyltransferase domain